MATVYLPAELKSLAGGDTQLELPGRTVRELIGQLEQQLPGSRERLCVGNALRPGLSVTVDGSFAALGMLQPLQPDSEVHFVPAVGGG